MNARGKMRYASNTSANSSNASKRLGTTSFWVVSNSTSNSSFFLIGIGAAVSSVIIIPHIPLETSDTVAAMINPDTTKNPINAIMSIMNAFFRASRSFA